MKIKTLSVTEVNNYIKKILDNDFILNNLVVKGEISNLKYHTSGHVYFSLKDQNSKINCVMFKTNRLELDFRLEEGMEVIIYGRASIYQGSGSLQLYVNSIKKEGIGDLYIKFEMLKDKLSKEGYFDLDNKKSLPKMPKRIGVVTSETGAVIRDIINVSKRRNKYVDIVLYPAKVQGQLAYKNIIDGIKYFNNNKSVDVIIIGRGGGSIEELWNFNEEDLAKEIFKSKIPIISAVGHEVDYTISDFVSDFRAATPSQGAEVAVPVINDINKEIEKIYNNLNDIIDRKLEDERFKISNSERILKLNNPEMKITNAYLDIDNSMEKLNSILINRLEKEKIKLKSLNDLLIANSPINILNKGYIIIKDNKEKIITSKDGFSKENDIKILLKDGEVKGRFTLSD